MSLGAAFSLQHYIPFSFFLSFFLSFSLSFYLSFFKLSFFPLHSSPSFYRDEQFDDVVLKEVSEDVVGTEDREGNRQ